MRINRNNYEAFFLDYHEGNFNEELEKELFLFLDNNPDLKKEFESFESFVLPAPQSSFGEKNSLKKSIVTFDNYQNYFIAYTENDLSAEEKSEIDDFIQQYDFLKPELEIFKKLKLVPDDGIVFENKIQLKKRGKIILFASPVDWACNAPSSTTGPSSSGVSFGC